MKQSHQGLNDLEMAIRACRLCLDQPITGPLPHAPKPVLSPSATAKICICGQAPGIRAHQSGTPFTDPSGVRLRQWMGISEDVFYDRNSLAIVPMGFCFPGYDKKGGDLPPRRECRNHWHDKLFAQMPQIELILVIGQYAMAYHLGSDRRGNLTETVQNWEAYWNAKKRPRVLPLPHPSWRNNAWLKRNPWFELQVLPILRAEIARLLA